jgi:hypothetical protein
MFSLNDGAKLDADCQARAPKTDVHSAPGSTWFCFTDQVPHAALNGHSALEQTFHPPIEAMAEPGTSLPRVLTPPPDAGCSPRSGVRQRHGGICSNCYARQRRAPNAALCNFRLLLFRGYARAFMAGDQADSVAREIAVDFGVARTGTLLFCSTSGDRASYAYPEEEFVLFAGAIATVLKNGVPHGGDAITFHELRDAVNAADARRETSS